MLARCRQWFVLVSPAGSGADNMALDHALLRRAAVTGQGVLRIYSWRAPTLSLGRHQPARDVYDTEAMRRAGVDVVRRPTGGRAVLHYREITYSVTAPTALDVGDGTRVRARDLYDAINGVLVGGLRALGAPAEIASRAGRSGDDDGRAVAAVAAVATPPSVIPCFDMANEGEVVAGGRKLAGSAQWREGGAVLQHGSILIDDDQQTLAALGPRTLPVPLATLRALLGHAPTVDAMADALRDALDAALAGAGAPRSTALAADAALASVTTGLRAHYADDGWTWRR